MIAYRPDIDGLRAIAILTVVGCHVGIPGWSGGYVGVDVFFVISGYLITSLLVDEAQRNHRIDLWAFYARRVRRLLPAFLTVLLVTLILGAIFLYRVNGEQQDLAKSAIAALLLNANHYFWLATGGYFDKAADLQPLLHIWSLSVEEQFYLAWPLALVLLTRGGTDGGSRRRILRVLALIFAVSLGTSVWLTLVTSSTAFYLMPARAWELAAGAIIALFSFKLPAPRQSRVGVTLGIAGLLAIAISVAAFNGTTLFPGFAALLPVLGASAVIAGNALAPAGAPARILSSRPMVFIGLVSYSWYLWHWPLLAIARNAAVGDRDLLRDFFLAGVVAFGLACATWRWIESPIRRGAKLKSYGTRRTVVLGALATATCVLLAVGFGASAKFGDRSPAELRVIALKSDRPPLQRVCHNNLNQGALIFSLEDCLVPGTAVTVDAVLWGDSYADHWMPAFSRFANESGISVYQVSRDACTPMLGYEFAHRDPTQASKCAEFRRIALDEFVRLRNERGLGAVILAASWTLYADERMETTLAATLDRLGSLDLRVLLIAPTPMMRHRVPECLLRRDERYCAIPRAEYERQRDRAMRAILRVASGREGVHVLDPIDFFCGDSICPAVRGDMILYTDAGHISASAARGFADFARNELSWLQ